VWTVALLASAHDRGVRAAHGHTLVEDEVLPQEAAAVREFFEVAVDAPLQLEHRLRPQAPDQRGGFLAAHAPRAVHKHLLACHGGDVQLGPGGKLAEAPELGVDAACEMANAALVVIPCVQQDNVRALVFQLVVEVLW
jgi:hypothetical protein